MLKQRVCQRAADALVEQNEHRGDFRSLFGEPVTVSSAFSMWQAMDFQLA
jgi:hypothetical protein